MLPPPLKALVAGYNSLLVALSWFGCYVTYGWKTMTHVAVFSTVGSVIIAIALIVFATWLTKLSGYADEEVLL